MYEQFMGDYTYRDSASRQVQLFISPRSHSIKIDIGKSFDKSIKID